MFFYRFNKVICQFAQTRNSAPVIYSSFSFGFLAIGKKRGFLISGGEINTERTAITLLDEFRDAKIGRITIDRYSKEELPHA